ncbi:MAG: hypothetical protein ABJC89_00905 [Acidobacteriota bacterium]
MRAIRRDGPGLLMLAGVALLLHGYHFGVEDQTLYLPAIERHLAPALFPHDAVFFLTETRFTWFDELTAGFIRATHLPLDVAVFIIYLAALLAILAACQRLLRTTFADRSAEWAGLLTVVILLPFPVAGTRMALVEWYLHPRGPAMACMLWAFVAGIERRMIALPLIALAAAIHPLTALWGVAHVACQARCWRWRMRLPVAVAAVLPFWTLGHRPPRWETSYWLDALSPSQFDIRYPINWPWYEWVGVVAPLALLAYCAWDSRRRGAARLATVTALLGVSGALGVLVALALTVFPSRRLPFQPMRELHIVYFVTLLSVGAWIEQRLLRGRLHYRLLFFVPLATAVVLAQPSFPSSPHVEWPGRPPSNGWADAFEWSRQHTPVDALFALDPFYLRRTTADTHSFRALAQRSMLAEAVHDLSPAAMSPALGARWMAESKDLAAWQRFTREDFENLKRKYGVSWVVLARPQPPDLVCPYVNESAAVCRL